MWTIVKNFRTGVYCIPPVSCSHRVRLANFPCWSYISGKGLPLIQCNNTKLSCLLISIENEKRNLRCYEPEKLQTMLFQSYAGRTHWQLIVKTLSNWHKEPKILCYSWNLRLGYYPSPCQIVPHERHLCLFVGASFWQGKGYFSCKGAVLFCCAKQ